MLLKDYTFSIFSARFQIIIQLVYTSSALKINHYELKIVSFKDGTSASTLNESPIRIEETHNSYIQT